MADALLIESSDFVGFPVGGQTSFARMMMRVYGPRLALVGLSTDGTPTGQWTRKRFGQTTHEFFAFASARPSGRRPVVPARLTRYLQLRRHRERILSLGVRSVFIQAPEVLFACGRWGWDSVCFRFAGIANSLSMPRYRWAKLFGGAFERKLCEALDGVDVILASADEREIQAFVARTGGRVARERLRPFPTRVDTAVFCPRDKGEARRLLGLEEAGVLVVSTGRINCRKGWDLPLEAFALFCRWEPEARLVFVGDGEDRPLLEERIGRAGLAGRVTIAGFQPPERVALYNNAADLWVNGSHNEGWAIAMVEAIACGKAVVSTDVSGAREMIREGANGYIAVDRDPAGFAGRMREALRLAEAGRVSEELARRYALSGLSAELGALWRPLARGVSVSSSG